MGELALVAMRCRTSDRIAETGEGAEALAHALGDIAGAAPRIVGSAEEPRDGAWEEDLHDSRGCLLEAGGQIEDAFARGAYPVLTASDCSICITTLPALMRHHPDAKLVWLDAHGDFNSPQTTGSGFLGGMCLAAACGVWDAGLGGPSLPPEQVVMCGVRDLDDGERALLDERGVARLTAPGELADAVRGHEVFVHLDLDVIDPSVLPAKFPAPGGLSDGGLRLLLDELSQAATLVGAEITSAPASHAELLAAVCEPLLASSAR